MKELIVFSYQAKCINPEVTLDINKELMAKIKVSIGIPVYNESHRLKNLINSIYSFTEFSPDKYKIVVVDDGSEDKNIVKDLKRFTGELNIPLISNETRKGVPYCWNRLTEHYDAEYVVLLNDDTLVKNKYWLKCLVYFLDNNPKAGSVSFPEIVINPRTKKPHRGYQYINKFKEPIIRYWPLGCFFGFRKKVWERCKQPDGSTGFWEDLITFYEENDFGLELMRKGFYNFTIPFPAMEHWRHQTLDQNPQVYFRKKFSGYLSKDEYLSLKLDTIKRFHSFSETKNILGRYFIKYSIVRKILKIPSVSAIIGGDYEKPIQGGFPNSLIYSGAMMAKKWGRRDFFEYPPADIHRKSIKSLPKIKLKWLDRDLKEREGFSSMSDCFYFYVQK
jgi:GT2 family glycosyltransferase